jgi:anti-sigma regulatory factor (Ser/Thr protein kinase)
VAGLPYSGKVLNEGGTRPGEDPTVLPRGLAGRLSRLQFALRNAVDVNEITRSLLDDLAVLPHVRRVGLALTEGAGRRLRFTATDAGDDDGDDVGWCHIDAYDDVPLTTVARTGESIAGDLAEVAGRYPSLAGHGERHGARSLATVPLPGVGSPMGGLIVYFDDDSAVTDPTRRLLEAAARRVSDAVRRVRVTGGRGSDDPAPEQIIPGVGGRRAELVLESDARSAGLARHFLRDRLVEWEVDPDTVDSAQLCLSELVTNAIMHAGTTSELMVHLEGAVLTVMVRDIGATARPGVPATYLPVPADDDPLRVFGRGLTLVDAIADRWGSEQDAYGTTAWFALELDPGDEPARTG